MILSAKTNNFKQFIIKKNQQTENMTSKRKSLNECQNLVAIRSSRLHYLKSLEITQIKETIEEMQSKYIDQMQSSWKQINLNTGIMNVLASVQNIKIKYYNHFMRGLKKKQNRTFFKPAMILLNNCLENYQTNIERKSFNLLKIKYNKQKGANKISLFFKRHMVLFIQKIKLFRPNLDFQNISSILALQPLQEITNQQKSQESTNHQNKKNKVDQQSQNDKNERLRIDQKRIQNIKEEVENKSNMHFKCYLQQSQTDLNKTKVEQELISKFMRQVFELRQKMDMARQLCHNLKNNSNNNKQLSLLNQIIILLMPQDMIVGQIGKDQHFDFN